MRVLDAAKAILTVAIAFIPNAAMTQTSTPMPVAVENYADDFLRFWDSTVGQSTPERVIAFKQQVAMLQPAFYGFARFDGRLTESERDAEIAEAIEGFAAIRPAYVAKLTAFDADLESNIASFQSQFPDFETSTRIYFLHSLGEMDGGTREIEGESALFFGADRMATVHEGWHSESAFFHHELFHVYHEKRLGECEPIWCSLWQEGLATYVAQVLNPQASDAELLLDYPPGLVSRTRSELLPALQNLHGNLDSLDEEVYADLFNGGPERTSLPRRRGYYLGLLVARELGRTRDLHTLANMSATEAKPLVAAAVQRLLTEAQSN